MVVVAADGLEPTRMVLVVVLGAAAATHANAAQRIVVSVNKFAHFRVF